MFRSKYKTQKRVLRKRYLIYVDGQTEIWYFNLLREYEKISNFVIEPKLPAARKLSDKAELIEEQSKIYDKVFWLVDMDSILNDNKESEFRRYYLKLKRLKNVKVYVNSPCLELWFLIHYKNVSKYFPSCDKVIKKLKDVPRLKDYKKSWKYYYGSKNIYEKLKSKQINAINNAERLGDFDIEYLSETKAEIYKIITFFLDINKF